MHFLFNGGCRGHYPLADTLTFIVFQVGINISGGIQWVVPNVCMPPEDLGLS